MTTLVVGAILGAVEDEPKTRYERFLWLLRTFAPEEGEKYGGNQRALARLIGKTGKKESYFGARLSVMREDDTAGVDGETMMQIMKATGVNPMWLLHGEGPRLLDARSDDLELATFLNEVLGNDDLREAAQRARATVEETRALLRLARTRELRTYASRQDGKVDWPRAFELQRAGILNREHELSARGAEQAKIEQERDLGGAPPRKITLPSGPRPRPRPRKR